jgi:protein phosphatase
VPGLRLRHGLTPDSERPTLTLPDDALVVLIGIAGSGKSSLAARAFAPYQILSSDALRGLVAGDPNDQHATDDAFRLLHQVLEMRLRRGRLTVVDATSVEPSARAELLDVAWRFRRPSVALVFDLDLEVCLARNLARTDGRRPPAAVRRQHRWLRDSLPRLSEEGFDHVERLTTSEQVESLRIAIDRGPGTTKRPEGTGLRRRRPKPPDRYRNP